MGKFSWQQPAKRLSVNAGQVHVWRIWLDISKESDRFMYDWLSPDEKGRAARFHREKDQQRYIAAHARTREILSKYLGISPRKINYEFNRYGKPHFDSAENPEGFRFNLSHSNLISILAVSGGMNVGVDLEKVTRITNTEAIAKRFFSPHETESLLRLSESQRKTAFYRCWTRKEAYIKARGMGMSIPLDHFEVSLLPGERAEIIHISGGDVSSWSLFHLEPGENYIGALAVDGHPDEVNAFTCWGWPVEGNQSPYT